MQTHRFGRKIKLPSTIAIKHQLRKLMFEDLVKEGEDAALQCSDVSGFEAKPQVAGTDSSCRAPNSDIAYRLPADLSIQEFTR